MVNKRNFQKIFVRKCPDDLTLSAYVDHRTSPKECRHIELHIDLCPTCCSKVDFARSIVETPLIPLPATLLQSLQDRIGQELKLNQANRPTTQATVTNQQTKTSGAMVKQYSVGYLYRLAAAATLVIGLGLAGWLRFKSVGHEAMSAFTRPDAKGLAQEHKATTLNPKAEIDQLISMVQAQLEWPEPQAEIGKDAQAQRDLKELMSKLADADRQRRTGKSSAALVEYGQLRELAAKLDEAHRPAGSCCCRNKNFLTEVYLPVSEASCYLTAADYQGARDKLKIAASHLPLEKAGAGNSSQHACECEVCRCLGRAVQNLLVYCKEKKGDKG